MQRLHANAAFASSSGRATLNSIEDGVPGLPFQGVLFATFSSLALWTQMQALRNVWQNVSALAQPNGTEGATLRGSHSFTGHDRWAVPSTIAC